MKSGATMMQLDSPDVDPVADFVTAGKSLEGGNLNDDEYIDILDFGLFANQFGVDYGTPDTTCATLSPHVSRFNERVRRAWRRPA